MSRIEDLQAIDMRVGTIIDAKEFKEARKPALKLFIDFGADVGVKQSSAQITDHYASSMLVGRQVVAVTNLPPRQIGPFMSEVLVLGASDDKGGIVLLNLDQPVPNGSKIH